MLGLCVVGVVGTGRRGAIRGHCSRCSCLVGTWWAVCGGAGDTCPGRRALYVLILLFFLMISLYQFITLIV